jgi:hypothetical protein
MPIWAANQKTPEGKHTAKGFLELQISVAVTCSQRFCGIEKRKLFGPTAVAHLLLK